MLFRQSLAVLAVVGGVMGAPAPRGNADLKVFADAFVSALACFFLLSSVLPLPAHHNFSWAAVPSSILSVLCSR